MLQNLIVRTVLEGSRVSLILITPEVNELFPRFTQGSFPFLYASLFIQFFIMRLRAIASADYSLVHKDKYLKEVALEKHSRLVLEGC
jgi:hypothetical protein